VRAVTVAEGQPTGAPRAVSLGRIDALDGLRAVFVLLVLGFHAFRTLIPSTLPGSAHVASPVGGGFLGVDLFFVLSGFLITTLLLQEEQRTRGKIRLWLFYRRRALRLLPALVAVVVAYSMYSWLTGEETHAVRGSILPVLFYYGNWAQVAGASHSFAKGLTHTWSLSVEEQFYVVWPIITLFALSFRRKLATVTAVLCLLLLAVALHRWNMFDQHPASKLDIYSRTDTRCDGLIVGALLAHWRIRGRAPRRGVSIAAWASTIFLAYCVGRIPPASDFYIDGGFTLVAIAGAIVILAAVNSDWSARRFLSARLPVAIGVVSYGIYLWHFPIFIAVQYFGPRWAVATRVTAAGLGTAFVTWLSWRFIERPFLELKQRLDSRPPALQLGAARAVGHEEVLE
jgi:peptidoglycan/LPS O-acetylase OafA/YrhL